MDVNDTFLPTLLEKERQLDKQLSALRITITLFQNGHSTESLDGHEEKEPNAIEVPKTYEEAITWNDKILFALSKIQSGFVQDIVDEILKHAKDIDTKTLFRKVTGLASTLKTKKILGGKKFGNKYKYFIK